MAKVVIVGAGFAGQTAALYLGSSIGEEHEICLVNPHEYFGFVPAWVWVGVGHMKPETTTFPLKKVAEKKHFTFIQGSAKEIHPDENYILVEKTTQPDSTNQKNPSNPETPNSTQPEKISYDYLIIATGPKLHFESTPGLGPHGYSKSICTLSHAIECRDSYFEALERMKKNETVKFVIGTGHPTATCQGAAFEYICNIHKDLVKKKLRDKAEIHWISNEPVLGDFGVAGIKMKDGTTSEQFIQSIFKEFDISYEVQKGVKQLDNHTLYWEDFAGEQGETKYDFAMLIPQFKGVPFKYVGKNGDDVSSKLTNAAGFIKVDAIYDLPYEELRVRPEAWPSVYQNPTYQNIFAAGIAFAPPGPISQPHRTKNDFLISAAPPRTGMVSGIIGRIVALNIIDLIKKGRMTHAERMSEMVAVCIASMGDSLWDGSAATMVMHPVVPDVRRYPNEEGRDGFVTHLEVGLSGAWMKRMIQHTFMHKLQGKIGWNIIPE